MCLVRRTSRRHSVTAGSLTLWLTLGAACSTLLADQMRRLRYSVVLRTPYESRRERQSKRGRQLLLLLWRFKRPNLAAKFATNRNVSLDKSKSFLQSVTHVAAGSAACKASRFRRQRHYVKGSSLDQTVCSLFYVSCSANIPPDAKHPAACNLHPAIVWGCGGIIPPQGARGCNTLARGMGRSPIAIPALSAACTVKERPL